MSASVRVCACTFGHPEKNTGAARAIGEKKCDALLLAKRTISILIKAREQKTLECKLSSVTTTLISQCLTSVETASGEGLQERKDEGDKKKKSHVTIYTTLWVPLSQSFNAAANAHESAEALQEQRARSHKNRTAEKEKRGAWNSFSRLFPSTSLMCATSTVGETPTSSPSCSCSPSSSHTLGSPTRLWHSSCYPEPPRSSMTRAVRIAHL